MSLFLDLFLNVVKNVADFPAGLADPFLHLASGLVLDALLARLLVIGEVAPRLFRAALHLVSFPLHLVLIHGLPSCAGTSKTRCVNRSGLSGVRPVRSEPQG